MTTRAYGCMASRFSILQAPVLPLEAQRRAALRVFAQVATGAAHRLPPIARRARAAAGREFGRAGRLRVRTQISWPLRAFAFPFERSPGAIRLRCESFRGRHRQWER